MSGGACFMTLLVDPMVSVKHNLFTEKSATFDISASELMTAHTATHTLDIHFCEKIRILCLHVDRFCLILIKVERSF